MRASRTLAKKLAESYRQSLQRYEGFAAEAERMLRNALKDEGIYCYVTSRVKTEESLLEKAFRPGKSYKEPFRDITDIIGLRVIVREPGDVEHVEEAICRVFSKISRHSEDVSRRLKDDQFGYRAIHVVVRLRGDLKGVPAFHGCTSMVFEIQIHTLIEHAWSELSHRLWYKPLLGQPDSDEVRALSALSAMLDNCENQIADLWVKARRRAAVNTFTCREFLKTDLARQIVRTAMSLELHVARANRDVSQLLDAAELANLTTISKLNERIHELNSRARGFCEVLRSSQQRFQSTWAPISEGFLFGYLLATSSGHLASWARVHMIPELREAILDEFEQATKGNLLSVLAPRPKSLSRGAPVK